MRRAARKLKRGSGLVVRVLVVGATGFVGPAVLRQLAAGSHEALGLSRNGPHLKADRNDPGAVARLAAKHRVEAVIDLLGLTLEATRPLLDALSGRIGRYVLASSGDVYRQYGALRRQEPTGPPLEQLAEDAPLRTKLYPYRAETARAEDDPQAWMDLYDKIPLEEAVADLLGSAGAVVRLPMVYGPGDRQRRFAWAAGPMRAGRSEIALDPRWAAWRSSYGYVEDVAAALALAATHATAGGGVFNAGPATAPDHAAWAERIGAALGWGGLFKAGRNPALDALDLTYPMRLDTRRIRRELGYAEPTDPDEALARTLADEFSRGA